MYFIKNNIFDTCLINKNMQNMQNKEIILANALALRYMKDFIKNMQYLKENYTLRKIGCT